LQVLNTALMTAFSRQSLDEAKKNPEYWGRLVESCIGASLYNGLAKGEAELFYWSGRNREVDFVLATGKKLIAIEVKSGFKKPTLSGMEEFSKHFKVKKNLLVGGEGIPLDEFALTPPQAWLDAS
jgi:predicted AAA+ superfamily ATPase